MLIMKEWAKIEDKKYSILYENGYPIGAPMSLINHFNIKKDYKAIDLGCGSASLSNFFNNYTGVDVSSYVINRNKNKNKGDYIHISLDDVHSIIEDFDIGICADVMEHIPENEVDNVLASISKLKCNYLYFGISTRKSVFLDSEGNNLHLTVWSIDKWISVLKKYFIIEQYDEKPSLLYVKCSKKTHDIILIGNGTSILDTQNGKIIDQYNNIVRFNSFKIKGFENYTGNNTNTWITVNRTHIQSINEFDNIIVHSWANEANCKLLKEFSKIRPVAKFKKDLISSIPIKTPSTGLIAIYYFLKQYDVVTITGFDWWDREVHHYGDKEQRGTLHKPDEEYKIIKEFIDNKKVKFL